MAAGGNTSLDALLRRSGWIGLAAFVVPLAVMLYLDRQYDVLSAVPLKHHPTPPLIAFLLLGTIGFPFGASLLVGGLAGWLRADLSQSWPTAPGRILHSEAMMTLGKGPRHYADVSYEYEVAGKRFTGSTVQFSQGKVRTNEQAQRIVDRYPVGSAVTVHYDANDPAVATLETSPAAAYHALWLGASVLLFPFLGFSQQFRDFLNG